ncbi:hypothetical protein MRX96_027340 [Rhipicephalus microplus]
MGALSNFKRVQQWATFTRRWLLYDAQWQNPFWSTEMISDVLQGKHKPIFSPTSDCGDHVVVTNCSEIAMPWYEWKYRSTTCLSTTHGLLAGAPGHRKGKCRTRTRQRFFGRLCTGHCQAT